MQCQNLFSGENKKNISMFNMSFNMSSAESFTQSAAVFRFSRSAKDFTTSAKNVDH